MSSSQSRGDVVGRREAPVIGGRHGGFSVTEDPRARGIRRDNPTVSRLAEAVKCSIEDLTWSSQRARKLELVAGALRQRYHRVFFTRTAKRIFDFTVASVALITVAPLLLTLYVAIRLSSPGPAVFSQLRIGRAGRPFRMYKFRTMYSDACNASGVLQTYKGDARITPVGRILRQCNLDELPQLWNVLRGDMSLVGPRPHPIGMRANGRLYEELAPIYALRHLVKPGITGVAQARGYRGPTVERIPSLMRLVCDLAYIANYSVLYDIKIVWMTLLREIRRGGTGD